MWKKIWMKKILIKIILNKYFGKKIVDKQNI